MDVQRQRGSLLVCLLLHGDANFSAAVLAMLPARTTDPVLAFYVYTALVVLTAVAVVVAGRELAAKPPDAEASLQRPDSGLHRR